MLKKTLASFLSDEKKSWLKKYYFKQKILTELNIIYRYLKLILSENSKPTLAIIKTINLGII